MKIEGGNEKLFIFHLLSYEMEKKESKSLTKKKQNFLCVFFLYSS